MHQTAQLEAPTAHVEVVEDDDRRRWDAFLERCGTPGLFFRSQWDDVFETYRLPCRRLVALRDGEAAGVLPLVRQKSLLFGDRFVSLPWFDAAGVLADDEAVERTLVEKALEIVRGCRAESLELRQTKEFDFADVPIAEHADGAGAARTDKVLMRLELPSDPEDLWSSLKAKVRNQIRKGEKSGLEVDSGGVELLDDFYRVYSRNMRDVGSPSHHRRFFEAVGRAFPRESRLYRVRIGERTVGAGWTMANGEALETPWASSLSEYNRYCVNHLMYWCILEDACRDGYRRFHFGRSSRDSGTYRFKKQWGAEPVQLYWYSLKPDGTPLPSADPQESYGWAVRTWKRLPLPVARLLGPKIIAKVA